jgi:hypothetical protein
MCCRPSLDRVDFRRDILPRLQGLPVRVIAEAMGSSASRGSKVRSGLLVPHKRHWIALRALRQPLVFGTAHLQR